MVSSSRHNGEVPQNGTERNVNETDFVLSASGTMVCHASYRILIERVTWPLSIYRGAYR